jgi:2-iminobutanoate/2-iminopropanoate deaminase
VRAKHTFAPADLHIKEHALQRQVIDGARIAAPVGPFSAGVRAAPQLFVSGQIPQDPETGRLVEGDVTKQARQVFTNVMSVLEAAGMTETDVIRVAVYLTDMADFAALNEVYSDFFTAPYPARTVIAVSALPLGARVEADVVVS